MRNGSAFCLMFLLLPGVAFGQASPALQLTTRIALPNVDGRMDHMGVDLAGQRLFATAFDNHTLQVIDLQAGRQVSTIANLDEPQAAYYDPATKHLFVTSGGDGTVKIFDGGTLRLLQTVKLIRGCRQCPLRRPRQACDRRLRRRKVPVWPSDAPAGRRGTGDPGHCGKEGCGDSHGCPSRVLPA